MEGFEKQGSVPRFDDPNDIVDEKKAVKMRAPFEGRNLKFDAVREREGLAAARERALDRREALEDEIRAMEQSISDLKASLLSKIISRGRIRALETKLGVLQSEADSETKKALRYAEFEESFDALVKKDEERDALLERERREAAEDAMARDVRKQIEQHNCFFVHDIIEADWKPSANNHTIDTKSVSFNDQVALINGIAPTLSASTVDLGSEHRTFGGDYGASGVFLSGGRILAAATSHMGTISRGLYERYVPIGNDSRANVQEAIEQRAHNDKNTYNELVISAPEISGVYFRLDSVLSDEDKAWLRGKRKRAAHEPAEAREIYMGDEYRTDGKPWLNPRSWKKMLESQQHGVPLYALSKNNEAFIIVGINPGKKTITFEQEVRTPQEVADAFWNASRDNQNPREVRKQKAEELFARVSLKA